MLYHPLYTEVAGGTLLPGRYCLVCPHLEVITQEGEADKKLDSWFHRLAIYRHYICFSEVVCFISLEAVYAYWRNQHNFQQLPAIPTA